MSPTTTEEEILLERVRQLAGLATTEETLRAVHATLAVLGEALLDDERRLVAAALPNSIGATVRSPDYVGAFGLNELFDRVRQRERVNLGFAREHVAVVLRVLGERLSDQALQAIDAAVPAFTELLRPPRDEAEAPEHRAVSGERHHSLATGRPGSRHPLSESAPHDAHAHSVAQEHAHEDSKLSSARGMTQEREDESLATAKPDTHRRISQSTD